MATGVVLHPRTIETRHSQELQDRTLEELSQDVEQIAFRSFSNMLQEVLEEVSLVLHQVWRTKAVTDVLSSTKTTKDYDEKKGMLMRSLIAPIMTIALGGGCNLAAASHIRYEDALKAIGQLAPSLGDGYSRYNQAQTVPVDGKIQSSQIKEQRRANSSNSAKEALAALEQKKDGAERAEADAIRSI